MKNNVRLTLIILLSAVLLCANFSMAQKKVAIPFRKGNLWGYADSTGKIIVSPRFDKVYLNNKNSTLAVSKDGKEGLVSYNDKLIIPIEFKNAYDLSADYIYAYKWNEKGSENFLFSAKGELIISGINLNFFLISDRIVQINNGLVLITKNKNKIEKWLVPQGENYFDYTAKDSVLLIYSKNETTKYKLINNFTLKKLSTTPGNNLEQLMTVDEVVSDNSNNEFTITNYVLEKSLTNQLVIKSQKDQSILSDFVNPHDFVSIIPFPNEFTYTLYKSNSVKYSSSWAILKKDNLFGVYITANQAGFSCKYDSISPVVMMNKCRDEFLFTVKKNGKWGIVTNNDEKRVDFRFEEIVFFDSLFFGKSSRYCYDLNDGIIVKTNNRFNIFKNNKLIFSGNGYEKIKNHGHGFEIFENGKKGFLAPDGSFFNTVFDLNTRFDYAEKSDKYELIRILNSSGKFLGYANKKGLFYFID